MIYTYFYCISLFVLTVISLVKGKILGTILFAYNFIISIFSCFIINSSVQLSIISLNVEDIKLWPFVFLILIYSISFYPFCKKINGFDSIKTNDFSTNNLFGILFVMYDIFTLVFIAVSARTFFELINSNRWASSYGGESLYSYSNIVEYFSINISCYLRNAVLISSFWSFSKSRRKSKQRKLALFTIFFCGCSGLFEGVLSTSRSMILDLVLVFVSLFVFFFNTISKKQKKLFTILMIFALIFTISIFWNISFSRFETRGVLDNLISYIGQSPLCFNAQLATKVNKLMLGEYAIGGWLGFHTFNPTEIGGTWGSSFYTYVGYFWIDWGVIGTIFLTLFLSFFSYKLISKKRYNASTIFLIFTIYLFYIKGAFVIGRDYCNTMLFSAIFYALLYFCENIKFFNLRKTKQCYFQ